MGIVIEPGIEWLDTTPADDRSTPDPVTTRTGPRRASTAWLVAAGALVTAVTVIVALPTHGVSDSPTNTAPATSSLERRPVRADELIANPVLAAPCRYLLEVAADALAVDRDSFARTAFTVSGTQGYTLNEVVDRELVAASDAASQALRPAQGRAAAIAALDVARGRADATPCSVRSTPG